MAGQAQEGGWLAQFQAIQQAFAGQFAVPAEDCFGKHGLTTLGPEGAGDLDTTELDTPDLDTLILTEAQFCMGRL